jgi:hypothetical protein
MGEGSDGLCLRAAFGQCCQGIEERLFLGRVRADKGQAHIRVHAEKNNVALV